MERKALECAFDVIHVLCRYCPFCSFVLDDGLGEDEDLVLAQVENEEIVVRREKRLNAVRDRLVRMRGIPL